MTLTCFYCPKPINPAVDHPRKIGWEYKSKSPSRRGGSDIILREPTGEWACVRCVQRLQSGLPVGQEALL